MSNYYSAVNETIQVRKGEELDLGLLEEYIRKNVVGLSNSPIEVEQFSTGSSNLTYLVRIGEWEAVHNQYDKT